MRHRTLVRGFVALTSTLVAGAALAGAADVFHGRVLFVTGHVPSRFGSEGAMIGFIRSHAAERITEDAQGKWIFEFMSFFAHPLNDTECTITFFDVEDGPRRLINTTTQFVDDRRSRVVWQRMVLERPMFRPNRHYDLVVLSRGHEIASGRVALIGHEEQRTGRVEFSSEETHVRDP